MDISWLFGRATTSFHHATSTLNIPLKDDKGHTSLIDLVRNGTPPCNLTPFLPTGHLQTVQVLRAKTEIPVNYRRHIFESDHETYPGTFAVDFVSDTSREPTELDKSHKLPPRTTYFSDSEWKKFEDGSVDDDTPMLLVLHGLSGGSHELYLRANLWPFVHPSDPKKRKWEACVVNARGCARSSLTSGYLFNARSTWDLRQIAKWARQKWPKRPLFGMGFSIGANIMVDYLGEEGEYTPLEAAVVLSNPWDLHGSALNLQRTWVGREVYSRSMGDNMRGLVDRHQEQLQKNPNVNVKRILGTKYLHEFDRECQGPTWGYPTEGAYYRDASSTEPLLAVRVPLLALNAEDDPVAPLEAIPFQEVTQNPHAVIITTNLGGHLGWFEMGGGRWMTKPIENFLRKMAEEVDLKALKVERPGTTDGPVVPDYKGPNFDPMRRKLELPIRR